MTTTIITITITIITLTMTMTRRAGGRRTKWTSSRSSSVSVTLL
jgi:hypothetical protein